MGSDNSQEEPISTDSGLLQPLASATPSTTEPGGAQPGSWGSARPLLTPAHHSLPQPKFTKSSWFFHTHVPPAPTHISQQHHSPTLDENTSKLFFLHFGSPQGTHYLFPCSHLYPYNLCLTQSVEKASQNTDLVKANALR